jgi:hypothetical protein
VSQPNQFNVEALVVDSDGKVFADKFIGSQFGTVDCDGSLSIEGAALISSPIISDLPTSNPDNIGGLWNNSGSINISTKDVLYNENNMLLDIVDSSAYISDLSSGYIEFDAMDVERSTNGNYLSISNATESFSINPELDGKIKIEAFNFISGISTLALTFNFEQIKNSTIRFSFDQQGNSVLINGNEVDVTYVDGSEDTTVSLPSDPTSVVFNSRLSSYCDNLVFASDSTPIISYSWNSTTDTFEESIEGVDGTTTELHWVSDSVLVEKYGYGAIPYETTNHYIPIVTIPFEDIPVDLSTDPTDTDRAYLRDRSTKEPYIPPTAGDFPNFRDKDVGELERNPDCWYYSKAMTCFSIMSEFHNFAGHVTLLSPRHAMIAEHIWDDFSEETALGKSMTFEDMSGNQQTVTSLDHEFIFPGTLLRSDMTILLLSEEITLDVDYATFFTDADFATYDYRDVSGCGPSKEGYFSIEKIGQLHAAGLKAPIEEQPEFKWSRWNNVESDTVRVGDSSSPYFVYNGSTLFFVSVTTSSGPYPYVGGSCIFNTRAGSWNSVDSKAGIKTAMDALDLRNGGLQNYNLTEESI